VSLTKNVGSAPGAARKILQRGCKVTKHGTVIVKHYNIVLSVNYSCIQYFIYVLSVSLVSLCIKFFLLCLYVDVLFFYGS